MSFENYNIYPGLTPVRVVDITNLAGTYLNGETNSGVGATLTVTATGVLTIDSVDLVSGDFVLLVGQTAANENGIYIVSNPGATGIQPVLTRRADFQNIEQIREGQYVSVGAGTVNAGAMYAVVEPLPAHFGIDNLEFNAMITSGLGTASTKAASDNAQPTVASVSGATIINDILVAADTAGTVKDSNNLPLSHSNTTSSATPGTIRSLTAVQHSTNAVMTTGNLVGLRGEIDGVGASGGFWYGVQGKIIPTGTLSGSLWAAPLFGQFDLSASTVNGAQLAPIWGDYGATSGVNTDVSGCRGIAMTNTTAAVLGAQVYLYGGATNLFDLVDNNGLVGPTYFVAAGTSAGSAGDAAHCAASKVLKCTVNGVDYWLPLFASNS